ncbi:MAG TPA: sigma-54 dependent transcriptional regulator [Candidatus Hydrogenedentes bacterium]|nr:sigma-54 dependent transcriptional regulator [Candidatus Hydrogenedentota bacterium]
MDKYSEPQMPIRRMLVVDDRENMRTLLETTFSERGFDVATASCGEDAIDLISNEPFDVVITDLSMPGKNGIEVLKAAKAVSLDTEVIIITAYGTVETAVEAMRLGACDFISKPFKLTEIELKVDKVIRKMDAPRAQPIQTWIHPSVQHFVGSSAQTRQLMKLITRIAPSKSAVLITGPSGVGKELVAKAIHEASPRRNRPFIALNCAALAPGVLESELFGHEKGAFTGAGARRVGRFERAHTGTLFLDEVGEIDTGIQTKLLRVLQEGEFERVGGTEPVRVDVRILAATNRDLRDAIAKGQFREDFYYRLNVFSLNVPPLCERPDDIPSLVDHFLRKFSMELNKEVYEVDDDVMGIFLKYPWPGNVRELENVIERSVVLCEDNRITRDELPPELLSAESAPLRFAAPQDASGSLIERTDRLESELIRGALEKFHWNRSKAAEHLGLKRTTLQYKIKKYGLE